VYVITPGMQLTIAGGVFALSAETEHYPVDTFFSSLAEDRGASAIGIVLSGSGTDGNEGTTRDQGARRAYNGPASRNSRT
jgi:two-component system CheB/CheR fusion protein